MLLVADNAGDPDQVTPLLPAAAAGVHRVLVTSRDTLTTLPNAAHLDLEILPAAEAVELLTTAVAARRAGDQRLGEEPGGDEELARLCGGLPLALQITAALLTEDPGLTVTELVGELIVENTRLSRRWPSTTSGRSGPRSTCPTGAFPSRTRGCSDCWRRRWARHRHGHRHRTHRHHSHTGPPRTRPTRPRPPHRPTPTRAVAHARPGSPIRPPRRYPPQQQQQPGRYRGEGKRGLGRRSRGSAGPRRPLRQSPHVAVPVSTERLTRNLADSPTPEPLRHG